jgi:Na+/phosphate symporter
MEEKLEKLADAIDKLEERMMFSNIDEIPSALEKHSKVTSKYLDGIDANLERLSKAIEQLNENLNEGVNHNLPESVAEFDDSKLTWISEKLDDLIKLLKER